MAQRYFLPELPAAGRLAVTGELAHHLGRVLRVAPGALVRLGDGRGGRADATVLAVDGRGVTLDVAAAVHAPPVRPRLVLAFVCPRLPRADWLFEHGTEVGVAAFQPLTSERSRPQGLRLDRWQKIVRAAAGQCDRDWLPDVLPVRSFAEFVGGELPPRRLCADRDGDLPDADPTAADTVLLVGPEGGFTDAERALARGAGFAGVRFGPHTLRTETAALIGAALLLAGARR